jgi:hypothetical protein
LQDYHIHLRRCISNTTPPYGIETRVAEIEGSLRVVEQWMELYPEDFTPEMIIFLTVLLKNYKSLKVSAPILTALERQIHARSSPSTPPSLRLQQLIFETATEEKITVCDYFCNLLMIIKGRRFPAPTEHL